MSLQPVEIICDAPPYSIVQACTTIAIEKPEDVRWWEVTHFLEEHGFRPGVHPGDRWRPAVECMPPRALVCPCGRELPRLVEYRFYFDDGSEADYSLGQCRRCKTVYWHGPKDTHRTEDPE